MTKVLFEKYKTAEDYAKAALEELQKIIKPTGFYRNKAKFIKATARKLIEDFDSEVPNSIEEMTKLPGVARKTANIVLSNAFGMDEGVAVDTHVMRLSKRLGFTKEKDRNKIEGELMKKLPMNGRARFSKTGGSNFRNCTPCYVNLKKAGYITGAVIQIDGGFIQSLS